MSNQQAEYLIVYYNRYDQVCLDLESFQHLDMTIIETSLIDVINGTHPTFVIATALGFFQAGIYQFSAQSFHPTCAHRFSNHSTIPVTIKAINHQTIGFKGMADFFYRSVENIFQL